MAIAGIDIGTSGCKVVVFDIHGSMLCQASRQYKEIRDRLFREIDPAAVSEQVLRALSEAARKCPEKITSAAITSLGESVVCIDEKGTILCNAMVTGDKRGIQEADEIREKYPEQEIFERTGLIPSEMYTLPKLLWMRKNIGDFRRTGKIFFFEDYISWLLTGERKVSYTSAARSMAFDIYAKIWDEELLALAELNASYFSEPVSPGAIVGRLKPDMASRLKLPPDMLIVAGGHDQSMAALGGGIIDPSLGEDGHGTCEFMSVMLPDKKSIHRADGNGLPCIPYILNDTYMTGLEITTCGALLNWSRNTLFKDEWNYCQENQLDFWDYMDKKASRVSTGVMILPQFGSSGTPDINYQVTGTIAGLTLHTTVDELYLALKEALAFQMKLAYEHATCAGVKIEKIVLTGGGARSDLTAQIRADVFKMPVYRLKCIEAGALGCMILAACAERLYPDIKTCISEVVKYTGPILPDEQKSEAFEKKYAAYKQLYEKMHLGTG